MKFREDYNKIVKIKKILVHNHIPMISENKVKECLIKSGLNQEIIWGDCYTGCKHNMDDTDSLEVQLGFTKYSPFWTWFFVNKDRLSKFIKGEYATMTDGLNNAVCLYYALKDKEEKQPSINFNFHYCINSDFLNLLKHELLHLKYFGHCNDNSCIFNTCSLLEGEASNFCDSCQKEYKIMINEIVEVKNG